MKMSRKGPSKAYNRDITYRKAQRKRRISRECCHWFESEYYDNLHQYSKNKIHCSCPDCNPRTRNKGSKRKRKNYAPSINYKYSDKKKMLNMDEQLREAGIEVNKKRIKRY